MSTEPPKTNHTNRLTHETSPYLKQHEHNPVDWYPWGEEALTKAKAENKPILLSVGYSACHWCHVMAHESFEDEEIAKILNEHFINIKVDREERPDLDQIYQNVAQAMTGGGGWPLTVFLLPDQRPFYGGTYFPPTDRYHRPGFKRLITALSHAFKNDYASVEENAKKLATIISDLEEGQSPPQIEAKGSAQTQAVLVRATQTLLSQIDWNHGGVGSAPKFPNPMTFSFLWRMSQSGLLDPKQSELAHHAVHLTLTKMAQGGIYDQVGGGFSRYSVDERWAVPHFEKMLYDNGLLLSLYSEVLMAETFEETHLPEFTKQLFVQTIKQTIQYVLREMRSPLGGFYAAQDADSEGEEGKFFVWDPKEIKDILGPSDADVFCRYYGVTSEGNFEHGKTVLHQALPDEPITDHLIKLRQKVWESREKRIRPGLDDKILVSWNGLMISGLIWGARALEFDLDPESKAIAQQARAAAIQAFDFIVDRAKNADVRLCSTIQKGQAKGSGYLDDYAFMARASLDLARLGQSVERYMRHAEKWCQIIDQHFKDPNGLGFYFTADDQEKLIQRPKSLHDQAIPSGVAVALGLMQLFRDLDQKCFESLDRLLPLVEQNPFGYCELLNSLLLRETGSISLTGKDTQKLIYHPSIFILENPDQDFGTHPFYCHRQACQKLEGTTAQMNQLLIQAIRFASPPLE